MPCYGPSREEMREEERRINKRIYGIETTDAGLARQVSCVLASALTQKQRARLPLYVRRWIGTHEKEDAARRKREEGAKKKAKTRDKALSKLTAEEKEVLGLD